MKKRIIQRSKHSKNHKQGTLNFSTTSNSNKIYPNFPSTTNNKYSNYEKQFEKSELSLLKNGINSIINNNNKSNYYIKLSPIKKKRNITAQFTSNKSNQYNK